MPRDSSYSGYSADRDRDRRRHQGQRPRAWSSTSDSSYTRARSLPRGGRRSFFSDDHTDRGRDLMDHRRTRLSRGMGYNPHGGLYSWSPRNSDEFYRPTRIPENSFNHWDHQQAYDDHPGPQSDRLDHYRRTLARRGYENDRQLDYSWTQRGQPVRRQDRENLYDMIREGREDDRLRTRERQSSRHYYRGRRADDADHEDNLSDSSFDYRRQRPSARLTDWARDWRDLSSAGRSTIMEQGLDELNREYLGRRRPHSGPMSEGPRERQLRLRRRFR